MADEPSTSGFLCHTCIWRSRSESHELLDIEALMRHGQRVHYLVPGQMGDYLDAAYHVYRAPKLLDGEVEWEYEKVRGEDGGVVERREKMGEWPRGGGVKVEDGDGDVKVKLEDAQEYDGEVEDLAGGLVDHSRSLDEPQGHGVEKHHELHGGNMGVDPALQDNGQSFGSSAFYNHSASFPSDLNDPKSGDQDALSQVEKPSDLNPLMLELVQKWWDEEWTLSHFDYELACSPIFAAQLKDYQKRMGMPFFGSQAEDVGFDELGLGQTRDRLQLWPEKATSGTDIGGKQPDIEDIDQGGPPLTVDESWGEAAELMDWWHLQGNGC